MQVAIIAVMYVNQGLVELNVQVEIIGMEPHACQQAQQTAQADNTGMEQVA